MKFMTITQVAESLAVHRRTVERLIKSGQLESIHVNSAVRITENSFKDFVNRNSNNMKKNLMAHEEILKSREWLMRQISKVKGKYSSTLSSSEDFALRKQEEIQMER